FARRDRRAASPRARDDFLGGDAIRSRDVGHRADDRAVGLEAFLVRADDTRAGVEPDLQEGLSGDGFRFARAASPPAPRALSARAADGGGGRPAPGLWDHPPPRRLPRPAPSVRNSANPHRGELARRAAPSRAPSFRPRRAADSSRARVYWRGCRTAGAGERR